MTTARESVIADYQELLHRGHWQTTHELLMRGADERSLRDDGKLLMGVLQPCFLEPAAYAGLTAAAELVSRAVHQLGRRLAVDAALRRRLRLTPDEEARVALEPNPQEHHGRLDGFITLDGSVRFLEYNSSIAAGPCLAEQAALVFDAMPIMAELRRRYHLRYLGTEARVLPACLRAWEAGGGRGLPVVGVVGTGGAYRDGSFYVESLSLLRAALAAGVRVEMVEPDALAHRHGRLWAGEVALDCVTYLDWPSFLQLFPLAHPLWRALAAGKVRLLGSFALQTLLGNKAAFALLSDAEVIAMFDPEVRAALKRHVPWSRLVTDGRTDLHGEPIDLVPFVARHRERFALKPTNQSGGDGVTLGWQCDAATWEAALARALAAAHVVQERVRFTQLDYPFVRDGALALVTCNEDCNPFIWNGAAAEGCMVRVSASAMLNLRQDGSLAPLYLVDPV